MPSVTHLLVAIAIVCNVSAQFLLKSSTGAPAGFKLFGLNLNLFLLGGLVAYAVSFYLTILIYKSYAVSFIGPLMMAAIVLLVAAVDKFLFNAAFDTPKTLGLALIFLGICAIAASKS